MILYDVETNVWGTLARPYWLLKAGSWKRGLYSPEDDIDVEIIVAENWYSHLDQENYIIGRL